MSSKSCGNYTELMCRMNIKDTIIHFYVGVYFFRTLSVLENQYGLYLSFDLHQT